MCGRFTYLFSWPELHRLLALVSAPIDFGTSYNVAPTQLGPIVRLTGPDQHTLSMLSWGFSRPSDSLQGTLSLVFNARSETLTQRPMFRELLRDRRCVVPVSGFYEWQALKGTKAKQACYITASDDEPLMLAGLWDLPAEGAHNQTDRFVIITTGANATMSPIHDRMPAVLSPLHARRWLNADLHSSQARELLVPLVEDRLRVRHVSSRVNSVRTNDPSCIAPASDAPPSTPSNETEPGLFA